MSRLPRTVSLVISSVVVGVSAWAILLYGPTGVPAEYQEAHEREMRTQEELAATINRDIPLGESFTLTGVDSDYPDYESLKETYLSSLGWVGTVESRVSQFEVFQTAQDTGIPELAEYPSRSDSCYAVATLEMTNVDAVASSSNLAGTEMLWPNISIYGSRYSEALHASENKSALDAVYSEVLFNDAEADQDRVSNPLVINLPPGESLTARLCFEVTVYENADGERVAPCALYFGDIYNVGYCRVDLGEVRVG